MCECTRRQLAVFDFDETILSVDNLLPLTSLLPRELKIEKPDDTDIVGWISYTNDILRRLRQAGFTSDELLKVVRATPAVPGMIPFLRYLSARRNPKVDLIIVSDANDLFINVWLEYNDLMKCFEGVYANMGHKAAFGGIFIRPYHKNNCPFSPPNFCKRNVMEEFVSAQQDLGINYERVIFVGDGHHDFCPLLALRKQDIACIRAGFSLETFSKGYRKSGLLRPHPIFWTNGFDLLQQLKTTFTSKSAQKSAKRQDDLKKPSWCSPTPGVDIKPIRLYNTAKTQKTCLKKSENSTCKRSHKSSININ